MEKERLVVRDFGPITDLDIEFCPLTFFVGTQERKYYKVVAIV